MKLIAQFSIVLMLTNRFLVRGEKILEDETLTYTGKSIESNSETIVKFTNKVKSTEDPVSKFPFQNDELKRGGLEELSSNFVKNSSEQNIKLLESDLVRIVLRDKEVKDVKEALAEESVDYKEEFPLPLEKQNSLLSANNQEGEGNIPHTVIKFGTHKEQANDTKKVSNESLSSSVVAQPFNLKSKEILDLLNNQEETRNSLHVSSRDFAVINSSFNLDLVSNIKLAEQNKVKQGDRGSSAYHLFPTVEQINQYEISTLLPNLTEDDNIGNHISKEQEIRDDLKNWQQFWRKTPSKSINEYKIEPKLLNNVENSQNSNLPQSELIEIILKEAATNLDTKQRENNLVIEENSSATSNSTCKSCNEKSFPNLTESVFIEKSLKEETNSTQQSGKEYVILLASTARNNNNSNLDQILFENIGGLHNFRVDNNAEKEEKFVSSGDSQNNNFPSEGTQLIEQSLNSFKETQSYNMTKNKIDGTSFNKLQGEEADTFSTSYAANEQTPKRLNSFKGHHRFNVLSNEWKEEAFNKAIHLNKTQEETDLIFKETKAEVSVSAGPSSEIRPQPLNSIHPSFNVTQIDLDKTALDVVTDFSKTKEETNLNSCESVATSSFATNELITEPLENLRGTKNYNQIETELEAGVLEGAKANEENYLNSVASLDKVTSPAFAAKELNFEPFNNKNPNKTENGTKEIVLKGVTNKNELQNDNVLDSLKSLATFPIDDFETTIKPENIFKEIHDFNGKENALEITALTGIIKSNAKQEAQNGNKIPLNSLMQAQNSNKTGNEMKYFEEVINLNIKQKHVDIKSKASSDKLTTETKPAIELSPQPLKKSNELENSRVTKTINTLIDNQQKKELLKTREYFAEPVVSFSSSEEEQDEGETVSTPKSLITLEEYAVKQMNFILDHLLLETQEFIAKVLQATINSVFPRDRLKHYAEDVNQVLNPHTQSDYSDEIFESQTASHDEIYEQIVEKLNFLKSKPSKYLQKQIPPEWLNEFHATRTELAIWLDKATEQMHKELIFYLSEEEDPIKYQYFNETFDDISRATEIHHKLALLADLVKIVKNKKQITFMDLYMQT